MSIPQEQRLDAVMAPNDWGRTFLHVAAVSGNVQPFLILLTAISEEQRLKAVLARDNWGCTALHQAVESGKAQMISEILAIIPEHQRLDMVLAQDSFGMTALDNAIHLGSEQIFSLLLNAIPEERRLAAIVTQNGRGYTVLHTAVDSDNAQILTTLLTVMSKEHLWCEDNRNQFSMLHSLLDTAISGHQRNSYGFFTSLHRVSAARQHTLHRLQEQMVNLESVMRNGTKEAVEQLRAALTAAKEETFTTALAEIERIQGGSDNDRLATGLFTGLTRNKS